ncbi:MAG: DNA starvation/stationary phase protection protein Dps [Geminicoccaceae bacterium]|nr:DNA starvation/stationary phase protection protein Dps [Geminicoccaceae bacterium]
MPESFAGGLDGQARQKSIDILSDALSDIITMALAVKQAHWNLKGPGFIGVHELLDDVTGRLRDGSDLMAERIVILGGTAKGTAEVVAAETELDPYPVDIVDVADHVTALKERMKDLGDTLRKGISAATEAGDDDTADLLTGVSRAVDKDAWFIGSNVRAET